MGAVDGASLISAGMVQRIAEMRREKRVSRSAPRTAFQMHLSSETDAFSLAPAPSRQALERQGARFVKLPRELYEHMHDLCDAQRRGELNPTEEAHLAQLMRQVSMQVSDWLPKPAD